ncbi:MAG: protein kinase [Planctomycetota bacterium]
MSKEGGKREERKRRGGGKRRHPDIEIARLLVKKKFIDKPQAMEALKEQKARANAKKSRLPLVQLLVKKKIVDAQRVAQIQDEIRRHTYICNSCDARTVLAPSSNRSESLCPRCGAAIDIEPPSGPSQASEGPGKDFGSARELTFPGPPGLDKFSQEKRAFGRYELLDEIGRGAMGVVYRAKHIELGKEVALKVLLAGEDARDAQVARFRREAAAVQKLRHEGIVPIHDFGSEGEVYFLTMELVAGGLTLHKQWKDAANAPPLKTRVQQIAHVADAIDHANARGVIHRDLKPANVLIGKDGFPRVADFGLAKDNDDDAALTLSQDRLGTPLFMAPEQVKRGSSGVDNRVDIWALGVMLFVSVTGRYPFRGRTIMSLYMKILNEEPDWYGDKSSSPDRDGWGMAPSPREVREKIERGEVEVEATKHGRTEVASHQGAVQRERPPVSDRLPPPSPFFPPPDLMGKEVPRDLKLIIEMALAKDPERRYETAKALAQDLERFLKGEAVRARPPGKLGRIWRRVKRRRAFLVAIPIVILAPALFFVDQQRKEQAAVAAKLKRSEEAITATEEVWSRFVGVGNPSLEAYQQAATALAPVCSQYSDQPAPFIRLGLASAFALDNAGAETFFKLAREKHATNPKLSLEVSRAGALLARLRGDETEAARLAREGLVAKPDDVRLVAFLARSLLALGKADEAEAAIAKHAVAGAPIEVLGLAAEVALARGDKAAGFQRAQLAQAASNVDPYAACVLGRALLARGALEEAKEQLRAAREGFANRGPTEARYFTDLAKARRIDKQFRDFKASQDASALAMLLAPWSPVPCFWRGDLERRELHEADRALVDYDECLARDPTFDEVAEIRAEVLLARRDPAGLELAAKRFQDEIDKVGRDRARVDLATILIGQGKLDEAKPLLEKVGADSPAVRAKALVLLIEIEIRAGRGPGKLKDEYDAALKDVQNANSARRRAIIAQARARLIAGDAKGALRALEKVPGGEDPNWTLFGRIPATTYILSALRGIAHAKLGEDAEAIRALEKAMTKSGSEMAAEVTPGFVELAPELGGVKATFLETLKNKKPE